MGLTERLARLERDLQPNAARCTCEQLPKGYLTIPWYRIGDTPGCPECGAQVYRVPGDAGTVASLVPWGSVPV